MAGLRHHVAETSVFALVGTVDCDDLATHRNGVDGQCLGEEAFPGAELPIAANEPDRLRSRGPRAGSRNTGRRERLSREYPRSIPPGSPTPDPANGIADANPSGRRSCEYSEITELGDAPGSWR